jgi:glycine/D-amino acid oxidase-like deaminating enzyme
MYHPSSDQASPPEVYLHAAPPAPQTTPLREPRHVAAAVIGAGFTGLSTALHLAEAGVEVAVLEAKQIGWGASGRAFGQIVPYLKRDHAEVLRHYGPDRGQQIVDAIGNGPSLVLDLIKRHGIECWAAHTGLIFAAHSPSGRRGLEARTAYWQQRGAPVEMLTGARAAELVGSRLYDAISLDRRGGNINPLAYTRGLGQAAVRAGATIHTDTPVRSVRRNGARWRIETEESYITADTVAIATNAYTNALWPGLQESIIPVRGHGFVSEPLSDNLHRSILPGRQSLTDTRHLFSGVRILPDGRLHASAHGPIAGLERSANLRMVDARIRRLFPQLGEIRWSHGWSGWVAMTTDHFPRLHELAPGLFAGLGYNGRGIAAATMMGRDLAALTGGARGGTVFPLVPLRPLRWRRAAPLLVHALVQAWRLHDAIDEFRFMRHRTGNPRG